MALARRHRACPARLSAAAMARRGPDGKTILLHAEQGYGDSIQMLRYLPLVKASGCARRARTA